MYIRDQCTKSSLCHRMASVVPPPVVVTHQSRISDRTSHTSGLSGLGIERRFQPLGQFTRRANTPVMQEHRARRFLDHMVMDRHNVDPAAAQGLEHRLYFALKHDEIAIDD